MILTSRARQRRRTLTPFSGGEVLQRVKCDKGCQQEFVLIEIGKVHVWDDIEAVGFTCPHCGEFYGHYQNDKIRRLQQEQQKLLSRGRRAKGKALKGIMMQIEDRKTEIKNEMERLRTELEGEEHAESTMS